MHRAPLFNIDSFNYSSKSLKDLSPLLIHNTVMKYFHSGPQLEKMMDELRKEMESNPPLPGAYTPKRGDLCASKFSGDSQW